MITIEKTNTEYTIKSLTVVTDPAQHSETDPNIINQKLQEVECNLRLKVDGDGNPIWLSTELEDLPKLIKILERLCGYKQS